PHDEPARERAAAAVLDRVAEALDRGRLADDAVVEPGALAHEPFADACGAIERGTFLVARDEQGDRARVARLRGDELLNRDDHRRDRALHVGSAAAIELAVAPDRGERIAVPRGER